MTQPAQPSPRRRPRSPNTFTQEWLLLCSRVSESRQVLEVQCDNEAEARSLYGQFNAWKSSLSRNGDANLPLAQAVIGSVQGTAVRFIPREENRTAQLLRAAIPVDGADPRQDSDDQPEAEPEAEMTFSDLLKKAGYK